MSFRIREAALLACGAGLASLAWAVGDTVAGRLFRLGLGVAAGGFLLLAATLGVRQHKMRWVKALPLRWLQQRHILLGLAVVPLSAGHMAGCGPLGLWSWALLVALALTLGNGAVAWFFKGLRPTATFAQQTLKGAPAAASLSPRQRDALAGSHAIIETQDQQLVGHRSLTLALLVLLGGHILIHLLF